MIRITRYDNGLLEYECKECTVSGIWDVSPYLSEDCVWAEDVSCGVCGSQQCVYILMCKTESKAKELLAKLEHLHIERGE